MQKLHMGIWLMNLHVCMLIVEDLNLLIRQMPVCSDSLSPQIKKMGKDQRVAGGKITAATNKGLKCG